MTNLETAATLAYSTIWAGTSSPLVVTILAPRRSARRVLSARRFLSSSLRRPALAGLAATAAYAPFVGSVWVLHAGLPWLWVAYGAWLIARSVLLGLRTRGERWMHATV